MSYYGNTNNSYSYGQPQQGAGGNAGGDGGSNNYSANQWQAPAQSDPSQQQQQPNQQQWQQQPQQQQQYNQWQQQPQQQQQAPAGQAAPMQQQQQQQQPGGFMMGSQPAGNGPSWQAAATTLAASAIATNQFPSQAMEEMGRSFLRDSGAKFFPGLEAFLLTLRAYFAVDNKYVLQKIQTIIFPFLKKQWQRNIKGYGGQDGSVPMYDLPIADPNAPDLYLPCMSLITYTLLCALLYGNAGKFNPEVIPDVTTKCVITQVLEVVFIRVGFYFLMSQHQNNPNIRVVALLDLLSYTGYKYLGLSINMLLGLMAKHFGLGARMYYIAFLWTASAACFFMLKTMSNAVPTTHVPTADSKRSVLVIAIAGLQVATMWFVSQTKFL